MQNFKLKKNILSLTLLLTLSLPGYACDSLKIEKRKFLAVKSNLPLLLFHGAGLQAEYIANSHTGLWAEVSRHREDQSMFDVSIREINFLAGANYYGSFLKRDTAKIHNGPYAGLYLKYKKGYYDQDKTPDYKMLFIGLQCGIQSVLKRNIIFNMGMGLGIGQFLQRRELQYPTFYDRYNFPLMDFRANILIGYMF